MSSQAESWLRLPCSCLTKYEEKKENKHERHVLINVILQVSIASKQKTGSPQALTVT